VALNSTYAVRLGSIVAGITWIVLLVAPGSRAAESPVHDSTPEPTSAPAPTASPTTVATTVPAPATIPPTTVAAVAPTTKVPPTTGKVPASTTTVRTFAVRDIVGLTIDRDTSWIAIATVLVVDQSNVPAPGVDVSAAWSYGPTLASCRTDVNGKCSMYLSVVPENLDAVTITVTAPLSGSKSIPRVVS